MLSRKGRGLALVLALILLVGALPLGAAAEEGTGRSGYTVQTFLEEEQPQDLVALFQQVYRTGRETEVTGECYDLLSARQQSCYRALENIPLDQILTAALVGGYRQVGVSIPELLGLTLTGTIDGEGKFTADENAQWKERALYTDLSAAVYALRNDRPDMLWLSDMQVGYRWDELQEGVVKLGNTVFYFRLALGNEVKELWEQSLEAVEDIAREADREPDTYSKLKKAYEILGQGNEYGQEITSDRQAYLCHQAYSALVFDDDCLPQCDGYAKAVKLVCGELGIPCVLVRSETHMWNNVQMDDGLWYNLDLTWDDEGEELSYDYFLIGSETVVDGQAFSQQGDHQEVDVYQLASGADPVTLPYPVKNREAYEYQGEDYPPLTFPDVTRDAWYFEAVEESAALGLFHGNDQGLFQPERDITRAEFCQVAANAAGPDWEDFEGENQFADVADDAWYVQVVAWAAQEGIMNGDGDGRFRPEDPITREEMCQVLYNLLGRQPVEDGGDSLFPDDGEISAWAREAVYACHSLRLVLGNDDGSFRPRENTQRSQAATVFVRYSNAA